jgi:predicted permease
LQSAVLNGALQYYRGVHLENLLFTVTVVLPLFLLMLAGYFLRKYDIFSEEFISQSNKACFELFLPCLIFLSMYKNGADIYKEFHTVIFCLAASSILIFILFVTVPFLLKDKTKISALMQGMYRCNPLISGLPLVINMYGEGGLGPVSMIVAIMLPVYNITAVIILSVFDVNKKADGKMVKKVLSDLIKNPLIIAAISAIFVTLIRFDVPKPILSTIDSISDIATPLALISLGGSFQFKRVSNNLKYLIWVCFFKLILMPAIVIAFAVYFGFRDTQLAGILVFYATPVAVSTYVMTREAKGDAELAGQIVVMSTMCSVFTLFIFIYVLRMFGWLS